MNTVADGIISLDDHGVIQDFNPAAKSIFGFASDEVVGESIRVLMPVPEKEKSHSEFSTDWAKMPTPDGEAVGRRKGGETFPMELAVREMLQGDQLSFMQKIPWGSSNALIGPCTQ